MNDTNHTYNPGDMEIKPFQNTSTGGINNRSVHYTLDSLNDAIALTRLGGILFVAILMIVGVMGNAHALYIYLNKFKDSNRRIFIISLAALDFTTCSIGMPFAIADLRNPLEFDYAILCKSFRFLSYIMSVGSICLLIVIALDRYQKICRPMRKSFTRRQSKIACGISLIIAVVLSWPAFVLYGRSTYMLSIDGIHGITCFTEDQYRDTNYQIYFMAGLFLLTGIAGVILILLYISIQRAISKQNVTRTYLTRIECKKCASLPRNQRLVTETSSSSPSECYKEECECTENNSSHETPITDTKTTTNSNDDDVRNNIEGGNDMNDIISRDTVSTSVAETTETDESTIPSPLVDLNDIALATYNRYEDIVL